MRVALRHHIATIFDVVRQIVAGEEAHAHPRAARRERFLATQGREDRLAIIRFRPHTGQARRAPRLIARSVALRLVVVPRLARGRHRTALLWLAIENADLAEVAVLLERPRRVVRVARADETEVIRVEAL